MLRHVLNLARGHLRELAKRVTRPGWAAAEKAFRRGHPTCAACGESAHLNVHHVRPWHLCVDGRLDPNNLLSLCAGRLECHFRLGHSQNWKAWNPDVVADAARVLHSPGLRAQVEREALKKRLGA